MNKERIFKLANDAGFELLDTGHGTRIVEDKSDGSATEKFAAIIESEVLREIQNWLPIETAPKDGTQVLVYGNGRYAVAHFDGYEWRDMGDIGWAGMHGEGNQPTHWMPLLPPDNATLHDAAFERLASIEDVNDPSYFASRADAWLKIMPGAVEALKAKFRPVNPKRPDTPFDTESRRVGGCRPAQRTG